VKGLRVNIRKRDTQSGKITKVTKTREDERFFTEANEGVLVMQTSSADRASDIFVGCVSFCKKSTVFVAFKRWGAWAEGNEGLRIHPHEREQMNADSAALTARNGLFKRLPRARRLTLGYKYFTATRLYRAKSGIGA